MLTFLDENSILQVVDTEDDRKFSVTSAPDQAKQSFQEKKTESAGQEDYGAAQSGLGYTCRKGLKPESPNQDSWSVLKVDNNYSIYGVFDGHGKDGHSVSNYVMRSLPKLIIKDGRFLGDDMVPMMKESFHRMQNLVTLKDKSRILSAGLSGTTASVVVHEHSKNKLTIAHVADSSVVLGFWKDSSRRTLEAIQLTRDHKPDLPDERTRIENNGGRVVFDGYANHRVYAKKGRYPGLNMSRCLGDLKGHEDAGCSCTPEVSVRQLQAEDYILLLCSDGVWEFITPAEAVTFINKFKPNQAMQAAEALAREAWDAWIREEGGAVVDDITVVLIYLNCNSGRGDAMRPMPNP